MVENGKMGIIVQPRNARALAEAMLKLLNNDELRKSMGENAYTRMKSGEYSWDKIAALTMAIYNEAVAAHSANKRRA